MSSPNDKDFAANLLVQAKIKASALKIQAILNLEEPPEPTNLVIWAKRKDLTARSQQIETCSSLFYINGTNHLAFVDDRGNLTFVSETDATDYIDKMSKNPRFQDPPWAFIQFRTQLGVLVYQHHPQIQVEHISSMPLRDLRGKLGLVKGVL